MNTSEPKILPELVKAFLVMVALLVAFWFLMADVRNRNTGVYYDCTMASFHPDIPPKAKEACQNRLRYEQDMQHKIEQEKLNKK